MIWPDDFQELVELQRRLGETRRPSLAVGKDLRIGGCFVCFGRSSGGAGSAGDAGWAAAAVMARHRLVDTATVTGSAGAAYAPGVLAAREGPLLHCTVGSLRRLPDVLLVNGSGRDHPRRAGMATHLGWALEVPTIGVSHRPLAATGEWPPDVEGAASPLYVGDEQLGWWVRTRRSARPLAVSPGWRMDLTAALEVMRSTRWRVRTPEPIRIARRLAREARNQASVIWAAGAVGTVDQSAARERRPPPGQA